jgi:UDP-N-acetylmuramoylalanine--D-glutamate ligase
MVTLERMMAPSPHVHPERIRNRRVAVLGLAKSGTAVSALLLEHGAEVLASEVKDTPQTREAAARLRDLGAWVEVGQHSLEALLKVDFVVPSPGVPATHPLLSAAFKLGLPVFSEIEVAFWITAGDVLAITGTNGKTTTVTLLNDMLVAAGFPARLAGNVGLPYASVAGSGAGPVVLELSSYQLEFIETFRPAVAGLLNLTPDHLDRHGSFEAYAQAKYRIAENQGEGDTLVLNADCPEAVKLPVPPKVRALRFSTEQTLAEGVWWHGDQLVFSTPAGSGMLATASQLQVPGRHNQANVAAAAAMALAYGCHPDAVTLAIRRFRGVSHRIEFLGEHGGVRVYNDSKATNVDAMIVALKAVAGPIVLLVGGRAKSDDPHAADPLVRSQVRAVVCFGEARERFARAWSALVPVKQVEDLAAALRSGFELARPGDALLLSPACASFDQFENYEQRGDVFRELVRETKD